LSEYREHAERAADGADADRGVTESIMGMRLADLSARLAGARDEDERRSIEASLDALTAELSRLKRGMS
jgi:hypothetical protein